MKRFLIILLFLMALCGLGFAQNTNLSNGAVFDGEPYLAVNPANPQHVVAAWMGYSFGSLLGIKTIVSFNGGKTWSAPAMLPHFSPAFHSADPCMVFDNAGTLFACYIDYRETPDSGGIYITKSTDGGLHWAFLSKALDLRADGLKAPIDRPWLTINPVNNHLYITSKPAPWVAAPNRPYFIASIDHGLNWSSWRHIDNSGFLVGNFIQAPMAAPAVSPDGAFHCMYPSWVVSQNLLPGYIHAKSLDDGTTFTYNGAYYTSPGTGDTLAKAGGHFECDPLDALHLTFVFPESKYGDFDIFFIESHNDGVTWSAPQRVNSDAQGNGKMQDLVWSSFDAQGNFVIAWRDRRNSPGTGYTTSSEIWGTMRWKDSVNFSRNFRISDTLAPYQHVLSLNGNDFMALAVADDTIHAAWGDTRNGYLNIWYSRLDMHTLNSTGISNIVHDPMPDIRIYPNPGNSVFYLRGSRVMDVTIYDEQGKLVREQKSHGSTTQIDLSEQPSGIYFLYIKTGVGNVYKRIVRD